jgi:nicotinate-nucleotide adenylyltransferase
MARAALDRLKLDRIVFLPTGAPRYRKPALASGQQRVAMLELALEGEPRYLIDARELKPGASGYTVDTLKELRSELGAELWLLVGADQYTKLDTWYRPDEVKQLARIAVFARPGVALDKTIEVVPMKTLKISSSDVRERIARGESISDLVPPAVANYIARERLYV